MKRHLCALICGLLLLPGLCFSALATDGPQLLDDANLLSQEEEEKLYTQILRIQKDFDFEVDILAYDYLEYYAVSYAEQYDGIESGHGVVLVLDMDLRELGVSARGDGEDVFHEDAREIFVLDSMMDALADDDFYEAFSIFLDRTEQLLEWEAEGTYYEAPLIQIDMETLGLAVVIALVLAALFATATVGGMKKKMNTAVKQSEVQSYATQDKIRLHHTVDTFLHENTTRVAKPKERDSGGGRRGGGGGGGGRTSGRSF